MEWHVFLSYSRLDDKAFGVENLGWVTRFSKDLDAVLPQVFGREVGIWVDKKRLRGGEYYAEAIDQAVAGSAILLPVISPSYLEDQHGWLARERKAFIDSAATSGGIRLGNLSRICPIERRRVNKTLLPEELRHLNII